jgi:hypothetical protein
MKAKYAVALITLSGLLVSAPAKAHHSLNAEFYNKKTVTLTGIITSIEWINPHIFFYIDTKDKDGAKATWAVETFPPNHMRTRYGLTKAVLAGDVVGKTEVTVELNPASNGKLLGWLTKITYPDGHFIKLAVDPESPEAR